MINLIPESAKQRVKAEYWFRVGTVWLGVVSLVLLLGAGILLPVYVLVGEQVTAYESSAAEASEKVAGYENISTMLKQAEQQAFFMQREATLVRLSSYIELFDRLEGTDIELTTISVGRGGGQKVSISLAGTADDRQALASFRDRLLADPSIAQVNLPISNLAKDKDITFKVDVTLTETAP